jgi:multicomponent Na+:H+ antiporter subunit G
MMSNWSELLGACLVLLGSVFVCLGVLGVWRFPDLFCRAHALTKSMTLGIVLNLIGMWVYLIDHGIGLKLVIAIVFQFLTIPIASHIIDLVSLEKNIYQFKSDDLNEQ